MAHTLNDYLSLLEREGLLAAPVPGDLDRGQTIALVSCDSRTVVPGTLFVCKGAHFKGEFLDMAQSRGAVIYASEKRWPDSPLPCILLSDLRRAMALMADLCYDHPSGKLKVIGFTGTKGKSSATYYLKSVLDVYRARQGKGETGVISSIDTYDGAERFESHLTTPGAPGPAAAPGPRGTGGTGVPDHGGVQSGVEIPPLPVYRICRRLLPEHRL